MDERDNYRWGTDGGDAECDNIVWGAGDDDDVVWGTSVLRTVGDNIVWGTDCGGADCDNIVWGTTDGDNIVWGTADGDNIVWGTAGPHDPDRVSAPDGARNPLRGTPGFDKLTAETRPTLRENAAPPAAR